MKDTNTPFRREARYRAVRAAFVARGSTLHAWCSENGFAQSNVKAAFLGKWTGPKAAALVDQVCEAAERLS